jgi:hypothetical protein
MIRQLPDQIMITETLSATIPKTFGTATVLISDSALKVVFSYYPVCRCQRTSRSRTFQTTKKLNLASDLSAFAKATAR